jgi:hypothetical protein
VLESSLSAALSQAHHGCGLLPDFLVFNRSSSSWTPPQGKHLESEHDGQMSWNACRTPWRLAHYYAVSGDARVRPLLENMRNTLVSGAHGKWQWPAIPAGLRVRDGKGLVSYSDKSFIAPAGYVCHVLGDFGGHQQAVKAMDDEEASYFGDSIDLLVAEQATHVDLFR